MCQNRIQTGVSPVGQFMTRDVATLSQDDTVHESLELMEANHLTAMPVVDYQGRCLGILARSDLSTLFLTLDASLESLEEWPNQHVPVLEGTRRVKVRELMSHEVLSIRETTSIAEAAQMMVEHRIHHLPVLNEREAVVGILSSLDIANWVAHSSQSRCCSKHS